MQRPLDRRGILRALPCCVLSLAVLAVLALLASAQGPRHLRILAGPVESSSEGVSGRFRIEEAVHGLASSGTGGACLVMREGGRPGHGDACRADADCDVSAHRPGSHGYCLDRSASSGKGRCWVRPGPPEDYCLQFKDTPAPVDQVLGFPRDPSGRIHPVAGAPTGIWRVHACLNGRVPRACADPSQMDKQMDDGPPARHRARPVR